MLRQHQLHRLVHHLLDDSDPRLSLDTSILLHCMYAALCVFVCYFFHDDKATGTHSYNFEVNWMQLPPSSVSLSLISQLASQPSLRPSSVTQSNVVSHV